MDEIWRALEEKIPYIGVSISAYIIIQENTMNSRALATMFLILIGAVSFVLAQVKEENAGKTKSVKKDMAGCCAGHMKASDQGTDKVGKNADECKHAEADCSMDHAKMSMHKTGGKMDCCAGQHAKDVKSENKTKDSKGAADDSNKDAQ